MIEDVQHTTNGNLHKLKLTVKSQRRADVIYVRFANDVEPVSIRLEGRDFPVRKDGRFGFTLFGLAGRSAEIEVAATTKSQLSFWVMDMSYGLATKTPVRPENLIGSSNSDATFVCRKYTL